MNEQAPIFKGATRPACIFGIPLSPFMGVFGGLFILAFWVFLPIILLGIPAFFIMRYMTKDDDQVFHQMYLYLRTSIQGNKNKLHWKNIRSFSPANYARINLKKGK